LSWSQFEITGHSFKFKCGIGNLINKCLHTEKKNAGKEAYFSNTFI